MKSGIAGIVAARMDFGELSGPREGVAPSGGKSVQPVDDVMLRVASFWVVEPEPPATGMVCWAPAGTVPDFSRRQSVWPMWAHGHCPFGLTVSALKVTP